MNKSHPSIRLSIRPASVALLVAILVTGLILWKPQTTTAQNTATPAPLTCNQLLPLVRTSIGTRCNDLTKDQVCYANKGITVEYADPANSTAFNQPGDVAPINALTSITTSPLNLESAEWGLAVLKVQANVPGTTAGQAVTFILYGDTSVSNLFQSPISAATEAATQAPTVPACSATTTRATFLRAQPDLNGEKGPLLQPNTAVDVTGHLANNTWVQAKVQDQTGWLYVPNNLNVTCDLNTLPTVQPVITTSGTFPASLPGSGAFYFSTGISAQAVCGDVAPDGMLIQSAAHQTVKFRANGVDMTIGSTVLLRAEPNRAMTVSVLEGQAIIEAGGQQATIYSGQELSIPLGNSAAVSNGLDAVGPPSPVRFIPARVFSNVCGLALTAGLTSPCVFLAPTLTPTQIITYTPTVTATLTLTPVPPTATLQSKASSTAVPTTQVPPTAVPTTAIPPTVPTVAPTTQVPPTAVPPTAVPPTSIRPTPVPPTLTDTPPVIG
ncbi:MAG: hypothetical protein ABI947_09730 [Chloroflexota bacterium]